MVNVYFSKSVDRQNYRHLAERTGKLKEYFVKFCGEQYRDKIEHFFNDCKFLIIDKTCPYVQNVLFFSQPSEVDSSAYFNTQILKNSFVISNQTWPSQFKRLDDHISLIEDAVAGGEKLYIEDKNNPLPEAAQRTFIPNVKVTKNLIKESVDTFYISLFSRIKNNINKDTPNYVCRYAFGDALRPMFEKIANMVLKNHNIKIKPQYIDIFKTYTIKELMQCCASFDKYKMDPYYINVVATDISKYCTGDLNLKDCLDIAYEIYAVGFFLTNQTQIILNSHFDYAANLEYNEECGEILKNFASEKVLSVIKNFYNDINMNGQTAKSNYIKPLCLINNNANEKTIVHEAMHGISFDGVEEQDGSFHSLNEVLTEFVARGVCRLMRKDNFSLLETNEKSSSGYSLALQYFKEFTDKYKDILIKAYFKDISVLFNEFGESNIYELDELLKSQFGPGYYDENIQTKFENLFDKIEQYRDLQDNANLIQY